MTETAVATQETEIIPIRSIIAPPGNFQSYMQKLITTAGEAIEEARRKVAKAEAWELSDDLEAAHLGLAAAQRLEHDEGIHQVRRWKAEIAIVERRKKVRLALANRALERALQMHEALRGGYVPLPRMPAVHMDHVYATMPPDVLDAFQEASTAGVFEEFRVIDGRDTDRYGRPQPTRSAAKRDPILVGMIGTEMFAIAWWR